MQESIFKVTSANSGMRLDLFITEISRENNLGFSRTFIQKLIQDARVTLNGRKITKPHHKVKLDDEFKITIEDRKAASLDPEDIPLDVVYEDKDLAIINKPPGMVVHPAPGNTEHTLVNDLLFRFKELSDISPQRPGIVHRLDKETSGLLVIAKNNTSHLELSKQFARHTIKRKYIALVKGKMEFDENIIELPIGRHPVKRKSMAVGFGSKSRSAKTFYRTLMRTPAFSMLELEPFTGRTHQLRVHLAFIGHPILGDSKYGKAGKEERLYLHARSLGFKHPSTGEFVEFSCDVPEEFIRFVKKP